MVFSSMLPLPPTIMFPEGKRSTNLGLFALREEFFFAFLATFGLLSSKVVISSDFVDRALIDPTQVHLGAGGDDISGIHSS